MTSSFHFLKAAIKRPLQISTIFQTSALMANRLISPLLGDSHCSVLELGVGAGAVTKQIYENIGDKSKYLGLEINEDLFRFATKRYQNLKFVCGSAEVLSEYSQAVKFDLIVSTLPWSFFDEQMQNNILSEVKNHLEKGGYFKTYMAFNVLFTKSGRRFQRILHEKFKVQSRWEVLNIPPARVFECRLKI